MKKIITLTTITLLHTLPLTAISCPQHDHSNDHNPWITLFNEQNLDGWTPKFNGHPPGENPDNIFRVIDGAITVTYQDFSPPTFKAHFGNLIYNQPLTNYHFKCDYRFFGEQAPGASSWAFANSGAMLHGESPQQMGIDQPHPTSLEFQFLAQDDTGERVTGSICSPGTYLDLNGQTIKKHVTKSQNSPAPSANGSPPKSSSTTEPYNTSSTAKSSSNTITSAATTAPPSPTDTSPSKPKATPANSATYSSKS